MQDVPDVCMYLKKRFPTLFVFEQAWVKQMQSHQPWLDVMYAILKKWCPNKEVDSPELVILIDVFMETELKMAIYTYLHALKNFPVRPLDKITTLCIVKHCDVPGRVEDYIEVICSKMGKDFQHESIIIGEFVVDIFTS